MGSDAPSRYHAEVATPDVLVSRLQGVCPSRTGWRARCPSCGGRSRKLTIAMADGRVLLHCFGGCKTDDVLHSVGLSWADVMPPRYATQTQEERRRARRAIREAGWGAALSVLAREATVAALAARQLAGGSPLDVGDSERLGLAVARIDDAAAVLVEAATWRPEPRP